LNTLLALNIGSDVNYGTILPGNNTGTLSSSILITSTGNSAIDVNLSGTDMVGPGNSISVSNQKYATSSVLYGSGIQLSSIPTRLELSLVKPTTHPSIQTENTYWGIAIPLGTAIGLYSGTITFSAITD